MFTNVKKSECKHIVTFEKFKETEYSTIRSGVTSFVLLLNPYVTLDLAYLRSTGL